MSASPMRYTFTMKDTQGTVGYVTCEPPADLSFDDALNYLEEHPFDEFMHKHLLERLKSYDQKRVKALLKDALSAPDAKESTTEKKPCKRPVAAALLLEASLLYGRFAKLASMFSEDAPQQLKQYTPSIFLKWYCLPDREQHSEWSELFRANMHEHSMLPLPEDADTPPLFTQEQAIAPSGRLQAGDTSNLTEQPVMPVHIREIRKRLAEHSVTHKLWNRPPAKDTAMEALSRLVEYGFIADVEMRHIASLSPIALLRKWNLDISVQCGRHNITLEGQPTSYGRGLSLADTRAGYAMEIVERGSSFASVLPDRIADTANEHTVINGRLSELTAQGLTAFDPNSIPLEVPYEDEPLYWMKGHYGTGEVTGKESGSVGESVWVPVQLVYMFCNLDEPNLFSAPGSTGLASGNILAEAKIAALTEILERDAEGTMPYSRSRCFTLKTDDELLNSLLQDYAARGVHVMFQDMTTEFGIPCYKAFVLGKDGVVARGTGAGLNGQRAIVSALTETPYPYPQSPPSQPALAGLPERKLEDLPDYSMEDVHRNLALLEQTLIANGRPPAYVDITREDLGFAVVKALVPDMEPTADFDVYTRMSKRLFRNYYQLFSD